MNRRIFRFLTLTLLTASCAFSAGCQTRSAGPVNGPATVPTAQVSVDESPAVPVIQTRAETEPVPDAPGRPDEDAQPEPEDEPSPEAVPTDNPAPTDAPEPTDEPAPIDEPEPMVPLEPEPEAEGETGSGTQDAYAGPDLAESEPVDDRFFSDAAFLGNSLVDGLRIHGGLEAGSFFAATSASVVNVDVTLNSSLESGKRATLIDAMTEKSYGKIYILLGINEIGFDPDYFSQLYGAMLDDIRQSEPRADIYIMSLSPVTESCSGYSDVFNMERINIYNEKLYALAQEKECYYVDLCAALAGEDGYLPADDSTDGIHFKAEKYPQWADYLRTHVK